MRRRAVILPIVLVLSLAGCGMSAQESAEKPETDDVATVQLRDGRVVDCVYGNGLDCDWDSPRKLNEGEKTIRTGHLLQAEGRSDRPLLCNRRQIFERGFLRVQTVSHTKPRASNQ